jgi:fumarate hydratase subunit beta
MASYTLTVPIADEEIRQLRAGDTVYLNGVIITGRDAAHKFLVESYVKSDTVPPAEAELYERLKKLLDGGVIYHCGPVVRKDEDGKYHFVAAGPTTSIREEVYQADVIHHFNLKGVIGKGGMAGRTLQACMEQPAVYLHAIGGAGTLIAQAVTDVQDVLKLEFGVPEAMWVIDVKDLPLVVTMDSHGTSIHDQVEAASQERFEALLA